MSDIHLRRLKHRSPMPAFAMGVVAAAAVGCGSGEQFPATYPASGVVTLGGQPVDEAIVSFIPIGDGMGADTVTGPDGTFAVQTAFAQGKAYRDGMRPGEYRVSVQKLVFDPSRGPGLPPTNALPGRYADPTGSGLTATVTEAGPNEFAFQLTD